MTKTTARKKKHGRKTPKIRTLFLTACLALIGAISVFVFTFDINTYGRDIGAALSEKTGRSVRLNGPIAWDFSLTDGLTVQIKDVDLGNPPWASQPVMAHIDSLGLKADLRALVERKLRVPGITVEGADILLESAAGNTNNWTFAESDKKAPAAKGKEASEPQATRVALSVESIKILNSRVGFKTPGNKATVLEIPSLLFEDTGATTRLSFKGKALDRPLQIGLSGSSLESLGRATWPFSAQATWGDMNLALENNSLSKNLNTLTIKSIAFQAGETSLQGEATVSLAGARPSLIGSLKSPRINIPELRSFFFLSEKGAGGSEEKEASKASTSSRQPLFSREPLELDVLKKTDLVLAFDAQEVVLETASLGKTSLKIKIENGLLSLTPLSVFIGPDEVKGMLVLNAREKPAQLSADFMGKNLDSVRLLGLSGIESPIKGQTDFAASLSAQGESPHAFALSARGKVELFMKSAIVSPGLTQRLASNALDFITPGLGNLTNLRVNCLATRYEIEKGMVETKGFLLDSDLGTVSGTGYANLPDEKLSLRFRTKPKNTGAVIPPFLIEGSLRSPGIHLEGKETIKNIMGLIMSDTAENTDDIPVVTPVNGANACAAALDNPQKSAASSLPAGSRPLLPNSGKLGDKLKNIGDTIMETLGGQIPFELPRPSR